jgi:NitT/TauT family transport system ATP-binding protein
LSKIEIKEVSLEFHDTNKKFTALDHINMKIDEGEFVCLIGPSGCGKSTLISLLAGLSFPSAGEILIDGKTVTGTGTNRGMVFQHYSLFPWLSAKKNISFGIKQANLYQDKKAIEIRAVEYLNKVGLSEYANKYPYQLSGGMQQRVAIARTLAMDTEILLMDEPFGAIDLKNRIALQDITIDLCKKNKNRKAALFVTHDIDEAIILADRIIFMEPKKIKEQISVDFSSGLTREEIIRSKEYSRIRTRLMDFFYHDVKEHIGGEEVTL